MPDESITTWVFFRPPADQRRADAGDSRGTKTDLHRGVLSSDRATLGASHAPCVSEKDCRWPRSLGSSLSAEWPQADDDPKSSRMKSQPAIVSPMMTQLLHIASCCPFPIVSPLARQLENHLLHGTKPNVAALPRHIFYLPLSEIAPIHPRPNGASQGIPGQRLGCHIHNTFPALKGRPNRCHSLSPASTSTWFSAQKIAKPSSPTTSALIFTPTWQPFSKTLEPPPFSSIPSKTTSTSCSISGAPHPSAKPWKMSKSRHPNGLKPKVRNSRHSPGRLAMVPSPFRNPMSKPSANTLPINANTTARNPFRRNTDNSSNATGFHLMRSMFGIDRPLRPPLWGSDHGGTREPRALPWATLGCPFGAEDPRLKGAIHTSAIGAPHASPGQRPGSHAHNTFPALKGRPNR